MAPYDKLGAEEWTRGQSDAVRAYVATFSAGGEELLRLVSGENIALREEAGDDPSQVDVYERTRNGIWGWVDDELAVFQPWGFDCASVTVPVTLWFDPDDPVLPPQHAEWLAKTLLDATLIETSALGHRALGDPTSDWLRLYSWLAGE